MFMKNHSRIKNGGLAMAKVTPEEFYEKFRKRLTGAIEDIKKGIDRTDKNPMERAVAKKEKWQARLEEAIRKGKWEAGLKRVDLSKWKDVTKDMVERRLSSGIEKSKDKIIDFAEQLLAYQDELKRKIESMPDVTLEDRIRRMETWIREMAKFERKK